MGAVKAGGTSVAPQGSWAPKLVFGAAAAIGAYVVHDVSSGSDCGWNYSAVGCACRAIILISVIAGVVAGALAAACARAMAEHESTRAWRNAGIAVGVLVLGTLAAKQFEDYRRGPGGHAGHIGWTGPRHPTFDLGAF